MAHRGYMGDREAYYAIPEDNRVLGKVLRLMKRSGQWNMLVAEAANVCVCLARWKTMGRKRFRSKTRNSTRGAQRTCRQEAHAR